jgi:hypothetical protein
VAVWIGAGPLFGYGLLAPNELERFTARTRATIESLAKKFTR